MAGTAIHVDGPFPAALVGKAMEGLVVVGAELEGGVVDAR